jgi:glycosyltransferase involved in cell wall biosynthesis
VAARNELGLPPDDLVIGTIGNINFQKNHIAFVKAAAQLKRSFPAARFVVLGSVPPGRDAVRESIISHARQLGLSPDTDVILIDAGERVPQLAQSFDIFWLTSRWEGIPTSIGEVMALNVPVVAFDVGAVREVVEDGVTGFTVRKGDIDGLVCRTRHLIENQSQKNDMVERARRKARLLFSIESCVETHIRALRLAVDGAAQRSTEEDFIPPEVPVEPINALEQDAPRETGTEW